MLKKIKIGIIISQIVFSEWKRFLSGKYNKVNHETFWSLFE